MARIADRKKGVDVRVLDVSGLTNAAACFVLVSGLSRPHVKALYEEIHLALKALGLRHGRAEGRELCWWVVLDYGDVVVHLMQPEAREYYDLEGLYAEAPAIAWQPAGAEALGEIRHAQA